MKPDPSSPSGENPPPAKPDAEKEIKSLLTGESDLWDFDDEPEDPKKKPETTPDDDEPAARDETPPAVITVTPRGPRRDSMPFKQAPGKKKSQDTEESPDAADAGGDSDPSAKRPRKGIATDRKPVEDAFDDLEENSQDDAPEATPEPAPAPKVEAAPPAPAPEPKTPEHKAAETKPAEPGTPKGLSKVEKFALLSFLFLVLAGGLFFVAHSISKLPEEKKTLTNGDFPIKGAKVETLSFKSYWRDPIITGDSADTVRRGTIIIPVVELEVSGGPAAVRVFFRNSDGDTVGDAVSRAVNGESTLVLPATAGFEEPGMYAAYRTGETKSWKVEVFEGPSAEAAGSDFKKLFEIPISTHRR